GDLDAEGAQLVQAGEHFVADAVLGLDAGAVHVLTQVLAQVGQVLLAAFIAQRRRPGRFGSRMRPDQLRPEIAEVETFAEGIMGPLGLPGLFRGLASILLRDTCAHHRLPATSPASSLRQRRRSCRVKRLVNSGDGRPTEWGSFFPCW